MGSRGIVLSSLIVVILLAAGVVLVAWLRRAPPPPVGYAHLHRGMTIATAERLLGPLAFMDTCLGCSYWVEIRDPRYGMVTLVQLESDSRTIDPKTLALMTVPHDERRIRQIQVMHWSRFDWLNNDSLIASWLVPGDG